MLDELANRYFREEMEHIIGSADDLREAITEQSDEFLIALVKRDEELRHQIEVYFHGFAWENAVMRAENDMEES
mgnify:CR=1 FL=1